MQLSLSGGCLVKKFKKNSKVDMQLSSSGGCLVKHAVTAVRRERQKSAGVEGSLGARADLSAGGLVGR